MSIFGILPKPTSGLITSQQSRDGRSGSRVLCNFRGVLCAPRNFGKRAARTYEGPPLPVTNNSNTLKSVIIPKGLRSYQVRSQRVRVRTIHHVLSPPPPTSTVAHWGRTCQVCLGEFALPPARTNSQDKETTRTDPGVLFSRRLHKCASLLLDRSSTAVKLLGTISLTCTLLIRSSTGTNTGSKSPGTKSNTEDKRMRREIANSNERRRMQSINAGFQSLKVLLPHHDGEKLSKVCFRWGV